VLKNARVVNVFTEEIERGDVAIEDGCIVGVGSYRGRTEVELGNAYVCPGLIDGHIHLESSMIAPPEFERAVLPHGTTAVAADPHEIANVAGTAGIEYMLRTTENLALDVFLMLPSCVPATNLDEAGAALGARELEKYYENPRVLGLAEMMNAFGAVRADGEIMRKLCCARRCGGRMDGHAPGLSGNEINAYVTAGVASDHECTGFGEALDKLRRGQWIMIREGTAAHNLEALLPLFDPPYYHRCMLVTDDKHPGDLMERGHIDYIIRRAVELGADPVRAVKMGSFNAAQYFGLADRGAVAPGYRADLLVVEDLRTFEVRQVYKDGVLRAERGTLLQPSGGQALPSSVRERVFHSFHIGPVQEADFALRERGENQRVIRLTPHELLTREEILPWPGEGGTGCAPGVDLERDVIKLAVLERHKGTGHTGLGFLSGYGLKRGAVASSIAHDSHNLIVAGVNDRDMAAAANAVIRNQGGLAVAQGGRVLGELPLPVAGLMSEMGAGQTEEKLQALKNLLSGMGVSSGIDPFMTLAFVSLPVIPALRLNTYGLIDVATQKVVPAVF